LEFVVALAMAVGIGLLIRGSRVLSAGFPLNDGGLFYAMMKDLQHAGYALPRFTSYNSAEIPFAYPPLGLYVGAFLDNVTPLSLLDVLRFLPLAVNTITIAAFILLARSLLSSRAAVIAAAFAFALLPRSFMWMIMGGGVTRSFGFLFAILALQQAHLMYTRRDRRLVLSTALFSGLTVLSHADMAWFLAFSAALMYLGNGRNRDGTANSLLVAAATLAITAPWWGTVIARYGMGPLLAAGQSRSILSVDTIVKFVEFNVTEEPLLPILAALGFVGALACLADKRFFLPVWLLVIGLPLPSVLPTVACVPLALLVGIGVTEVLLPAVSRAAAARPSQATVAPGANDGGLRRALRKRLAPAMIGVIVGYSTLSALIVAPVTLAALPAEERGAMHWIAENTPPGSEFLVLTSRKWQADAASEWFPVLAERTSVATAQGIEWLPAGAFEQRVEAHRDAQSCAWQDATCLENWSSETGLNFTHVYVSKRLDFEDLGVDIPDGYCLALCRSLLDDPNYLVIYDGPAAIIFARRPEGR
jgi:hypothetical protein